MGLRRRIWRNIDREKAAYRRAMRPLFRKALDLSIKPFWAELSGISDITHLEVPDPDRRPLEAVYKRLYMTAALEAARRDANQAKGWHPGWILVDWIPGSLEKTAEDEMFTDAMTIAINDYLATEVGLTITALGNTTKAKLQRLLERLVPEIIDSGIGGGAAQTALRDTVQSAWHRDRYFRTERIVRTEVNRATNWGSLKGVQSTGVPHYKVWLSAFTQNSRAEHTIEDGQKVDSEENFLIDGEDLQYPCDPAGSPGNTINCLCSMTYETKQLEAS